MSVALIARAEEYTSSSFKILDPVLQPSGYASSTNFQLWSTMGEAGYGVSSATSYGLGAGFLRIPVASPPVLALSGVNSQLDATWSSATGYLGFSVAGYDVGYRLASTSPYTFVTVGNVNSYSLTPVTVGTSYFVVVRALDSYGFAIATSSEVIAATSATAGGGVTGFFPGSPESVIFSGSAYPGAIVSVIRDGRVHASGRAGSDGEFNFTAERMSGTYVAQVSAVDVDGQTSSHVLVPIQILTQFPVSVSRLLIPPTARVVGTRISGHSIPASTVVATVTSGQGTVTTLQGAASQSGAYTIELPQLPNGTYTISVLAVKGTGVTQSSRVFTYTVGPLPKVNTPELPAQPKAAPAKGCTPTPRGDLNCDKKINSTDYNLLRAWYGRTGFPAGYDLTKDGKISAADFARIAAFWTGD